VWCVVCSVVEKRGRLPACISTSPVGVLGRGKDERGSGVGVLLQVTKMGVASNERI
jgi:Fe-S-cluster-containing dehydrogenase component